MEFLNEGIPLDGLGIQGHTKEYVKPDPTAMWVRTHASFLSLCVDANISLLVGAVFFYVTAEVCVMVVSN